MSFSVQKHIQQAEKLIKLREYKKAKALYLQILKKFPNNINAMHSLKKLKSLNVHKSKNELKQEKFYKLSQQYNKKEFEKVIQEANKLIKVYPKESDLYNIQGASNAALGKFEKAIKCYEKILQIDPSSAKAYYNIAVMYDSLKAPKESIKYYKYAVKSKSDYTDAYNNMGSAYRALGNLEDALKAYNKVININPNHAYAQNNIGNLYLLKQLPKEAIKAFKKAYDSDNSLLPVIKEFLYNPLASRMWGKNAALVRSTIDGILKGSGTSNSDGASSGVGQGAWDFALTADGSSMGVDGLAIGAGYGEAENGSEASTTGGDNAHTTAFANYSVGPVTFGAQMSYEHNNTTGTRDEETTAWGLAFNVNENLSISVQWPVLVLVTSRVLF